MSNPIRPKTVLSASLRRARSPARKSRKIRIGIVGCGAISHQHLAAYRTVPGVQVVQFFDVNPGAASAMAVQEDGATVPQSLAAMAAEGGLDAVSVCTPPAFHLDTCRPFLRAGIPILCEKPLEADPARARALRREVRASKSLFMTAFCHRFHPPVVKARAILARGDLGRPLFFRNTFAGRFELARNHRSDRRVSGGGCIADNAAHSVDLFRFLMGEVISVQAMTANLAQQADVEDFGLLILRGKGGTVGEIMSSYSLPSARSFLEVLCSEGTLTINYGAADGPVLFTRVPGKEGRRGYDVSAMPDRFSAEVREFVASVRSGAPVPISVDEGLACLEVISAAYRSAQTRRVVAVKGTSHRSAS